MLDFRPYQTEAVDSVFDYFSGGGKGNPVIELPTGTGKSLVIAGICKRALDEYPKTRIIVGVDSKTLVEQNAQKLLDIWPQAPVGIYSAALDRRDTHCRIIFAGIDSVAHKSHLFGPQNLFLNDECHMFDWAKGTRYGTFVRGLQRSNPKVKGVGLSASPWRAKIGHITNGGYWTDVCYSKIGVDDFHDFVANGWMAPLHPLRTDLTLDVSKVSTSQGDFNKTELQDAVDKETITKAAIIESLELAADRKHWLVFCSGVQHVEHTVQYLREMGVSAVAVHSKQSQAINDANVRMYLRGEVRALVNMGVLTKGFDAPETDYIMMLRPTKSATLWVQMLGRGTRPAPWCGKIDCLVGDFAGNARRLGPINDPVLPGTKGSKGGTAPVKKCESCKCENHVSAKVCQRCGEPFPEPKPKITTKASTEKLMKERGGQDDEEIVMSELKVDAISYSRHAPPGKPPMFRVTYTCGLRMFSEFVCVEHEGYALKMAHEWWRKRFKDQQCPTTAQEMLDFADFLPRVTHVRVWMNKKPYPQIMAPCFDGTCFGNIPAYSDDPPVSDDIPFAEDKTYTNDFSDDDIPF